MYVAVKRHSYDRVHCTVCTVDQLHCFCTRPTSGCREMVVSMQSYRVLIWSSGAPYPLERYCGCTVDLRVYKSTVSKASAGHTACSGKPYIGQRAPVHDPWSVGRQLFRQLYTVLCICCIAGCCTAWISADTRAAILRYVVSQRRQTALHNLHRRMHSSFTRSAQCKVPVTESVWQPASYIGWS